MRQQTDYLVEKGVCEALDDIVDPDVTGLGVVSSFLISITFNFLAIILAYLCRWLPNARYSAIDNAFISQLHSLLPWSNSSRSKPHPQDRQSQQRELERTRAFESFMLAMSDQQLITGVALTITTTFMTFTDHLSETFSVYSLQIATRLGYLSCIVHLCLISLLREHFDHKKGSRNFRVVLVAIFLMLLIICMVISESVTLRFNRRISVKCARQNFRFVDPMRPQYVLFSDEVVVVFNLAVLIFVIVLGYSRRFLELYHKDARAQSHYWSRWSLHRIFGDRARDAYDTRRPDVKTLLEKLREYHAPFEPHQANKSLAEDRGGRRSWKLNLEHELLVLGIWVESVSNSFLWDIIWLSFYFVFGIGSFWNFYIQAGLEHSMEPNFGQLVPLILVCLPFLSAWEVLSARSTTYQDSESPNGSNEGGVSHEGDTESSSAEKAEGIWEEAEGLFVSLRWFQGCTFLYWLELIMWALMFSEVIPGAFYVSIIACFIFIGHVVTDIVVWLVAAYDCYKLDKEAIVEVCHHFSTPSKTVSGNHLPSTSKQAA